ncbi:hypothetical protein L198_05532 [Cryptococcus wingfieldii CBS 7118]|uniref:Uncharacterized protein n=1 Tax=Cryptococcus wingfieldii CBS 7118 TaxID=1295528 RepID=A0A1E3IW09_9TREE|nr:hypothetical protein L198_05532 [Cryptococcus wingfieldii CBS 7118]ODN92738.1 hypothetical protein L198_05532 [Cryptococcus wingfieldii CBS 7118]
MIKDLIPNLGAGGDRIILAVIAPGTIITIITVIGYLGGSEAGIEQAAVYLLDIEPFQIFQIERRLHQKVHPALKLFLWDRIASASSPAYKVEYVGIVRLGMAVKMSQRDKGRLVPETYSFLTSPLFDGTSMEPLHEYGSHFRRYLPH